MTFLRRSSHTPRHASDETSPSQQMPAFLRQTRSEIHDKFKTLEHHQQARFMASMRRPSSTSPSTPSQWARLTGDAIAARNRYSNIDPWSSNRIILRPSSSTNANSTSGRSPSQGTDYINASPIALRSTSSGSTKRYIATQGPTALSTPHMWRMVLQETGAPDVPAVVVMLTQLREGGREKCFQYFPHGEKDSPLRFSLEDDSDNDDLGMHEGSQSTGTGEGEVHLLSSDYDTHARTTIRTLRIDTHSNGQSISKRVHHLLFEGWPDFGVPSGADKIALLALIKLSAKLNEGGPENPRIVHCSAGVGRSGTFIALDYLLGELGEGSLDHASGNEGQGRRKSSAFIDAMARKRRSNGGSTAAGGPGGEAGQGIDWSGDRIAETVDRLRQQRMMMVQGESQFEFLYELMREQWLERQGRGRDAAEEREEIVRR